MIRIREFSSNAPGPRLLVFGAIHGNEVCGPLALERLASELESGQLGLSRGSLRMVPVCNEGAFVARSRYVDENLNRVFQTHDAPRSHERRLANQLAPLVEGSDYLLDLHSMQAKGDPFVFLNRPNPHSEDFCKALGTEWIVKGWPELYESFPELQACCTQTYADRQGVPNALIECGSHDDPAAAEVAYGAVRRALAHLGMAAPLNDEAASPISFLTLKDLYFRESEHDAFAKTWRNFESIEEGELVGFRGPERVPVLSPRQGVIVFPSPVSSIGTEWFYVAVRELGG
jgi:predicted deacylase